VSGRNHGAALGAAVFVIWGANVAHGASEPYPSMAPRDQYLTADRSEEIALARSAASPSVSDHAGVMVLGPNGFETVEKGSNGFVCLVERAWDKPFEDPEFWNPKMRAPICMNDAAVRTVLPVYIERAQWALSGLSRSQMEARAKTSSVAATSPAPGAMSFMLSRRQYLSDTDSQWHPHVMFFSPRTDPSMWGANLKGSPVLGAEDASPITMFFIPVRKWSDGTLADYGPPPVTSEHHH
jgi:hypothetical protein